MFEPDKSLRTVILENLTEDGMSISALSRHLNNRGIKIHRLELSGYLKALSDLNIIREREVKPSKVFSLSQIRQKNIYQQIGEVICQEESDDDRRANLALYFMNKLFRRAIFERELRMTGIAGSPNCKKANEKERTEAAQILMKSGIKILPSDVALVSNANLSAAYNKILASMLIEIAGLKAYVSETKQKTLLEG